MQEEWIGAFVSFFGVVERPLYYKNCDAKRLQKISDLAEDQRHFENMPSWDCVLLLQTDLFCARVRRVPPRPMKSAVCSGLRRWMWKLRCAQRGDKGMGIPERDHAVWEAETMGDTLCKALELGVYKQIAGDGRGLCDHRELPLVSRCASAQKERTEVGSLP